MQLFWHLCRNGLLRRMKRRRRMRLLFTLTIWYPSSNFRRWPTKLLTWVLCPVWLHLQFSIRTMRTLVDQLAPQKSAKTSSAIFHNWQASFALLNISPSLTDTSGLSDSRCRLWQPPRYVIAWYYKQVLLTMDIPDVLLINQTAKPLHRLRHVGWSKDHGTTIGLHNCTSWLPKHKSNYQRVFNQRRLAWFLVVYHSEWKVSLPYFYV